MIEKTCGKIFNYGAYEDEPLDDPFMEAFSSIAHYNGHREWLAKLSEELKKIEDGNYAEGLDVAEWYTDKHALWMMLVAAFGDWGVSIRTGWISNTKEAARFIDKAIE